MLGRRKFYILTLTAVLGLAMASTASAGLLATGSVAFSSDVASYVGATLAAATSITLGSGAGTITGTGGLPFHCPQADCTPIPSATFINPTTFTVPLSAYANFVEWGDGLVTGVSRYQFTVTSSFVDRTSPNALIIYAAGLFHDNLGTYNDASASLIYDLTQVGGPGHAISASGTIQTPSGLVPEPATMAMLGSALIGLGIFGRKRFTR